MTHNKGARLLTAIVAAAAMAGATYCKNSNSVTGPPAAPSNVAGAWTGTFDSADPFDCDLGQPAQATFSQNISDVVGTMTAGGCGFTNAVFQGTIRGSKISGSILNGGVPFLTVSGSVYGANLENLDLSITTLNGGLIPGGQMHLHR